MSSNSDDPIGEIKNDASVKVQNEEDDKLQSQVSDEIDVSSKVENEAGGQVENKVNVLHDLESLLKKSVGDRVLVIDYETSTLLPEGENYGSSILKVEANIKITEDSSEEKLHLVAKILPTRELKNHHMKMSLVFKKEIFIFDKLVPAFREIEAESVSEDEKLIDLFPKFYGGRLSRSEKEPDKINEDAVILLENLSVLGYENMDKKKGLDLEHAKLAIGELARFHGLGRALRYHDPDFYQEVEKNLSEASFEFTNDDVKGMLDGMLKLICQDSRIADHEDRIRDTLEQLDLNATELVEPWVSITHDDFWVNNIMFRHDKDGKVDDIKFVDFQVARIFSPVSDLPFFLCTSTNHEVFKNHMDELLDIYYERFIDTLRQTGCDISPFTRESFDQELKKAAKISYLRCIMVIRVFTDTREDDRSVKQDLVTSVIESDGTGLYFDRVWEITSKYLEKKWF